MAARIPNTATRQTPRAKSTVKPKIASLEAYTAQPLPAKGHTAQITALRIDVTAEGLALFGLIIDNRRRWGRLRFSSRNWGRNRDPRMGTPTPGHGGKGSSLLGRCSLVLPEP